MPGGDVQFEVATATRILFGAGRLREIGPIAKGFGHRALVVTGRRVERAQPLLEALSAEGVQAETCPVPGEPTTTLVTAGAQRARESGCELVIGCGGGSALDAGKAIAALMTNRGELIDYLEVIGRAQPLTHAPAPFLAVPTTAGTGAEVTRNAVLASPEHGVKVSLRSPLLLPKVALIDPELTYGLPPEVTASTGLDALTQLIEPFVSHRANPFTDALCRDGMQRAARSLRLAYEAASVGSMGKALPVRLAAARVDLALASLFSGLALANAGLGAAHGLAAPICGRFAAPHGAVCAALLPHVMEANLRALRSRAPETEVLRRFDEVAARLTGEGSAPAEAAIAWVKTLCAELAIPPLSRYGVSQSDLADLAERAAQASSMKANPIGLTAEELEAILAAAL
jgi:alcohol dehydrogenase class IV